MSRLSSDKLTVSYKQIASIPIGVRARAATNGLADLFASALTPGQRAALFPSYYKNSSFTAGAAPSSSTQVASLESPSRSSSPPGGAPQLLQPSDTKPLEQAGIPPNLVPVGLVPGPDGKPMRPADTKITASGDGKFSTANATLTTVINTLMAGDPTKGIKGLPFDKARLLAANFGSESSFDPRAVGDKQANLDSTGLGQWNRTRKDNLYKFASDRGEDWSDPKTQSLFSLWEFQYTHTGAYDSFMSAKNDAETYHVLRKQYEGGLEGGTNKDGFDKWLAVIDNGKFEDPSEVTATPVDNVYNTEPNATPVTATAVPESNAVPAAQIAGTNFIAPVNGTFEGTEHSNYGAGRGSYDAGGASQHGPKTRKHSGSDWQAPNGSTAIFPVNGTIVHAGHHSGYEYMVDLKGDDGKVYRMATHGPLAEKFKVGQQVKQGTPAGTIAEGHLHMEIIPSTKNGKPNPVYAEFDREVSSGTGGFVSTSNQRGTVDQEKELGLKKGTAVSQGTPVQTSAPAESIQTASATPTLASTTETYKMDRKKAADMIRATPEFKKAGFLGSFVSDDKILNSPQFKQSMADRGVTVNADGTITVDKTAKKYDADALKSFQTQGIITPTQVADASSVMPKTQVVASDVGATPPSASVAPSPAAVPPNTNIQASAPPAQQQASTPLTTPPRPMDIRSGLNVARGATIPPSMTSALERANGKALDESWGYQGTSPGI